MEYGIAIRISRVFYSTKIDTKQKESTDNRKGRADNFCPVVLCFKLLIQAKTAAEAEFVHCLSLVLTLIFT